MESLAQEPVIIRTTVVQVGMKRILTLAAAVLLLAAACDRYPEHSVVVNSTDALVNTAEGTLPELRISLI